MLECGACRQSAQEPASYLPGRHRAEVLSNRIVCSSSSAKSTLRKDLVPTASTKCMKLDAVVPHICCLLSEVVDLIASVDSRVVHGSSVCKYVFVIYGCLHRMLSRV